MPKAKTKKVVETVFEDAVEVERVEEPEVTLEPPSPVDRGQLYVESHPILGVTKTAHVTKNSVGDGRLGDGATIERNG